MPRRRRYYYDDYRYWRRSRFGCWQIFQVFLYALGFFLVGAVLLYVYLLLRPYMRVVGTVFLIVLVLLVVGGLLYGGISLYGKLQDVLQKRDNRDTVVLRKGERLATRHSPRQTRRLSLVSEAQPLPPTLPEETPSRTLYGSSHYATPPYGGVPAPYYPTQPLQSFMTSPLEQEQEEQEEPQPQPVYFAALRRSLQPGQVLKGVDPESRELRTGDWDDFKTLLVLGSMASGKTTDIVCKTVEAVQGGAEIIICDAHAKKPDSLYRRVLPLAAFLFPGTHFAISHDQILNNVLLAGQELERRIQGGRYTRPLVLVVDEVNRLADDEEIAQELLAVLAKIGREGRDFHVYVIAGLHEVTHLARLRKKFVSCIVHRVDSSEAEHVIPGRFARLAPELPNGQAFVKDAYGHTEHLLQPLITVRDIETIASELAPRSRSTTQPYPLPSPQRATRPISDDYPPVRNGTYLNRQPVIHTTGYSLNAPDKRLEPRLEPHQTRLVRLLPLVETDSLTPKNRTPNRVNVPNELRRKIVSLRRAGVPRRQIMTRLGLHGEKYKIIQRVLEEEGLN
jgi:hypothetical protein